VIGAKVQTKIAQLSIGKLATIEKPILQRPRPRERERESERELSRRRRLSSSLLRFAALVLKGNDQCKGGLEEEKMESEKNAIAHAKQQYT
jgi:hypothetical protein